MATLASLTLEVPDPTAAEAYYDAFGVGAHRGLTVTKSFGRSDAGEFTDPDGFAWETASA